MVGESSAAITQQFWKILLNGMSKVMHDSNRARNGPDQRDYAVEMAVFKTFYRPIMVGIGTSCFCFVLFRVAGSSSYQKFLQGGVSSPRSTSKPQPNKKLKPWKSFSEREMDDRLENLNQPFSWQADALLSVLLGMSATAFATQPKVLRRAFVLTPLLPGKSLVSEHLCADMTRFYDGVDPLVFAREKDNETITTLRTFAVNCKMRDERERGIRRNQNLPDGHPVSIPYPGILGPHTDKNI